MPNPHGRKLREEEIAELIGDVDALIAGTEPLNAAVLERAGRLRVISRVGVGLENVDLNAALQMGIVVRNTPEALTDAVAELTLGGILNVIRQVGRMDRDMHGGAWERQMGGLLRGQALWASSAAAASDAGRRAAHPFEIPRILASDRAPDPAAVAHRRPTVELDELLRESQVVTLHLSGSVRVAHRRRRARHHEAGRDPRQRGPRRPGRRGRAGHALRDGHFGGAYLDTFAAEPYDGPLREAPDRAFSRPTRARMQPRRAYAWRPRPWRTCLTCSRSSASEDPRYRRRRFPWKPPRRRARGSTPVTRSRCSIARDRSGHRPRCRNARR